ncbi:MAG: hypothetical protein AUK47_04205 [Deltaproteobacteria bacterium CG2_30_63_29]|nr:MAG: hypothetical protein AUK47_04205 [Deltaproteobacteria bacterium CG2_30_63_29]PIW01890.1 MAG: hypothetical protein COW42_03420 [Deltaproteobacteria bacterium CG17_big_fil_post_rev_8_21_14_2_50_63_7]
MRNQRGRWVWMAMAALALLFPSVAFAQSADQILASFDDEPTVLEVQAAALTYSGLDPDRVEGWNTRANLANLLPERASYTIRYQDQDRTMEQLTDDYNEAGTTLGAQDRRELRTQTETRHEGRVEWDFSKLIFNPEVLRVAREVGSQTKLREDVLTTVTKIFYERRRAQIDIIMNPPSDAADKLRKELRVQELTADIDAMTGSWFSSELKAAGKNPY